MRVLPWPWWTSNPYLRRFCAELERRDITVLASRGLRSLGAGDWAHFHWPGAALMSRWRSVYTWRIRRFGATLRELGRRGVRLAWTAHNLYPHDDPHPDLGRAARAELVAHLDHVFVHFPSAIGVLATELGYRGATSVVPHGHYIDDYGALRDPAAARAELGLPATGFVGLMLGQLRPYKGIGEAIAAFRAMAGADDRLVIAGRTEGTIGPELALGRGDPRIVVHRGRVPAAKVAVYHAAADCVVAAHRATFTSGSAVMALSLGCPIVGPAVHHLASLGPEPRLFAAEATPGGIAHALQRRREAGPVDREQIRTWAREHLSWQLAGDRAATALRAP